MKKLLSNDKAIAKIMKTMTVLVVLANIVCGIIGLVMGKHMYFISLSIWAFSGIILMIIHGVPTLGRKNMIIMFFIGCIVSLFFESMGCNFGIFFSKYVYTEYIPGPKLFGFNIFSMAAYGLAVYQMFSIGQAAVGMFNNRMRKSDVITIPLIAGLATVSIDYMTDPFLSTISQTHIWQERGVFYGIPYQNYLGWYLLAFTLYFVFALVLWYQQNHKGLPPQPTVAKKKAFWVCPAIMFCSLFLQLPFYALISGNTEIINSYNQIINTHDIYWGVMIVCTGSILAPMFITIFRILRGSELE